MSQARIFLDTNVLVCAHDSSSRRHAISAALLTAVIEGQFQAVLAEQNLLELYRVLTNPIAMKNNPLSSTQVKELIETFYLQGSFQIVYPTEATLQQVLKLATWRDITSARIYDLRIAIMAIYSQVDYLVTFNTQGFAGIDGLTSLQPQQVIISE